MNYAVLILPPKSMRSLRSMPNLRRVVREITFDVFSMIEIKRVGLKGGCSYELSISCPTLFFYRKIKR